jgi:hypothetical protein
MQTIVFLNWTGPAEPDTMKVQQAIFRRVAVLKIDPSEPASFFKINQPRQARRPIVPGGFQESLRIAFILTQ